MKILAIDTSSSICSVCITEDEKLLYKKELEDSKTHSQKLMPMIDTVLKNTKLRLEDMDLLACCIGPGSFTGIRIGIATIKAFADSLQIPVVGINSLESLACNVEASYFNEEEHYICSLIDAKNENVYYGLFQDSKDHKKGHIPASKLEAKTITEVIEELKKLDKPVILVGDGASHYQYRIQETIKKCSFVTDAFHRQTSVSIARCAFYYYQDGHYGDSNTLVPLYLRKSQAERALEGEK